MGRFFERDSAVHRALNRIARRLDELKVPYAISGGMALNEHGYGRTTDDVDILVTREGLHRIHAELEGLGYVPPFAGSKNLRDVHEGVRIEFLIAGDYPGDGKPKPVAFPDPAVASVELNGIRVLGLVPLIELKLASGMTNALRLKDLGDVQELMKILGLDRSFAERIHPFVRPKFIEFCEAFEAAEGG